MLHVYTHDTLQETKALNGAVVIYRWCQERKEWVARLVRECSNSAFQGESCQKHVPVGGVLTIHTRMVLPEWYGSGCLKIGNSKHPDRNETCYRIALKCDSNLDSLEKWRLLSSSQRETSENCTCNEKKKKDSKTSLHVDCMCATILPGVACDFPALGHRWQQVNGALAQ